MLTWLRELAETVGTFDRSALEPGFALRCTIGVAIPLVVAAMLGDPAAGVAAAIGAFITGFTSLQGVYRTRLTAVVVAALGMAATSFVGALAAHSLPALIAATAVAAYACATIGQIGPMAATVALNSFVAFVLFSSQPVALVPAAEQSGLVLAGGVIQALLLLLAWPVERRGAERTALADVYRKLAEYARAIGASAAVLPPITPLATARQILADPQPFARSGELARLNRLLEDAEVVRRRLGALAATNERGALPRAAADRLDAIAEVLEGRDAAPIERAWDDAPFESDGAFDVAAHLRDALEAATMLASGRLPAVHLMSRPRPGPYVSNQIDWRSRDAVRFTVVLCAAMLLGRHFSAERGYWIPLTAALVLKPDFATTFVRGAGRIAGTLVGAVVAGLVVLAVHGEPALQIAAIVTTAAVAYVTFNPNYALFTVAITSFVAMVLGMRGMPATAALDARVLDTLAGGALAMVGYVALPSWERRRTRSLLADLLDAQRRLATAVLRSFEDSSPERGAAVEAARTGVWKVRTAVEASIDRTRGEPQRPHTIGAGRALRILAATQRFALASLVLEAAAETHHSRELAHALEPFADAINAEMAELAQALRESRPPRCDARLAAEVERVTAAIDAGDPERRFIADGVRAYAETTTRLRRLLGARRYA